MQGLLLSASRFGSRALGGLATPSASQSLLASALPALSAPCLTQPTSASTSCRGTVGGQSLCTSASAWVNDLALARGEPAGQLSASTSAPALHLDGSRSADPGEPRYTAPYWVPEDVRRAQHLPEVLFTDPWNPSDEPELRRRHAALCLEALRHADQPLTAEQVRQAVNAWSEEHGGGAQLSTTAYVSQLLEHMRRTRLVYGKKNPESTLPSGHPAHPRVYIPLPYQAARMGKPETLAAEDEAARAKAVDRALRRLRNRKTPFPIHRRRARFSIWQAAQAEAAVAEWQQNA